jgi:hypothetical protein
MEKFRPKMNEDTRTPFLDAVAAFKNFAADHGKPHDLAWISQDRVRVKLGSVWIFRPSELTDDRHARCFYESARETNSSLKLYGIGELDGYYVAGVEGMPSPPHHPKQFYMSLHGQPRYALRSVTNRIIWAALGVCPTSKRDEFIRELIELDRTTRTASKSCMAIGNRARG